MENISKSIKRFDFDDKVEGKAKYCADLHPEGMLYARTLRSEVPRAKIRAIRLPELPEGYTIIDHRDIPGKNVVPIVYEDQPFLATDEVNYIGQPILLVVGADKEIILEIINQIEVEYQPLTPILSIEAAVEAKAPYLFGDKPYFVEYSYAKGDPDKAITQAVRVVEDELRTGYQEHVYLEPQALLGVYDGERVSVYGSMQCPYYIHSGLKQALGWGDERVRVVQLPTGGGFGGKEEYPTIPGVHVALAAIKTGKPVQLVFDRQEDIRATTKRHPSIIKIKSHLDAENRIIAREIDVKLDAGAYAGLSSVVLQRTIFSVCGVYDIPNLKVTGKAYATNNIVTGAFRGFGGPQAFFAIEMHMEHIAKELGADPLVLRRSCFLEKGDTSSTGGVFHSDIKLAEIADKVARRSGYQEKRGRFAEGKDSWRGIGCSFFFHGCGFTGAGEAELLKSKVKLRKYADSTVGLFVSSTEMGQGALTTLRKIVAETLGIPIGQVKQAYPDTAVCPDSGPTVASRTVMIVGRLLQECAEQVKQRWDEEAFEVVRDYVYPQNLSWDSEKLSGNAYPEYSWGANVVEVAVDPMTYEVGIKGVWAVYDIGTPIDEKIVQGQIEGGIMQGLGYAAMERLQTAGGRLLQESLAEYLIPAATDFPRIALELIENPYAGGPFGAKGLGELPMVGVAPAVAAAVEQAIGKKIDRIPLTPEYIRELMR
ncbi:xanthine dehydrogenase family protein molybdopterin-binding subunit [Trichococcus ilyis]|uniref:Aldehyde oxidase/xanthine dehydrogenase a/b hammerhead n=1 Tax=Trichococcus ilyis TaxID=640938 RepID=A0A143Z736_9LACT|nr:xanthine dehydrogenase family protein molybdopterin-binding subunit [Trichococcus ilyis]CZR08898.1 aldehyde oxidase/xanthine dehydrogenase a/b hammerhead [Trichococcus ilyis]SEJ81163.1 xanthine dehydrogenase, molybdenum binding subunit apoprotein [Trichococcus ilyis]